MALILLLISGLMVAPLLAYMNTGLRVGEVYENRAAELYAADAGVEDAMWKVEQGVVKPPSSCDDPEYWAYNITDVNGKRVDYSITYLKNNPTYRYLIQSTAISDGGTTTVESYVKFTPGSELNIFGGALASKTSITLKKDSTVNGDVYYCSGSPLDPNQVSGNWTPRGCGEFPQQTENLAFAAAMKALAMNGTTYPNGLTISEPRSLGPAYIIGNLYMSRDVTVTITGVVYVTGTITAKSEFTLAGCGVVVAEGDIYLSKIAAFGDDCDSMLMSLNGSITFKKEATVNALIYAPNGPINFDKSATVFGGVVGQSIEADKEGSFTYVPRATWDLPGGLPGAYTIETYSISHNQ